MKWEGKLNHVKIFIRHEKDGPASEIPMCDAEMVEMRLIVPTHKPSEGWKVQTRLNLQVQNLKLKSNMGNIVKMSMILEDNADEESPFIKDKKEWYKNIDMNLDITSGSFGMDLMKSAKDSDPSQ